MPQIYPYFPKTTLTFGSFGKDRIERNDDQHSGGGFKRNYSNNFGNRASNNGGGPNANANYRN